MRIGAWGNRPIGPASAIALFWFFYFAGLGIFFPYYGLYLRENAGLGGTQVGLVLSVGPLVGVFSQPIWGQIADRTGRRTAVLTLLTIGTALGSLAIGAATGFAGLLLATAFLSLFANALLSISMSIAFGALRDRGPHAFGLVRVWGTVGYLVGVIAFPAALHVVQRRYGLSRDSGGISEPRLELMFGVIAVLTLVAAAVGPVLPRGGAVALRAPRGEWPQLLRIGALVRLVAFTSTAYVFLQGPIGMFPVYVRAEGGDMDTVGRMWVLMLLVEIPLIALSGAGMERIGARGLLAIGVLSGGFRWMACGLTSNPYVVYPVQLLHGAVVAGLTIGGPLYLEALVPERLRSTGQALLASVGVGCGGIVSNVGAGWLLEHVGPRAPYLVGGAGAILLGASVPWFLPKPESAPVTTSRPSAGPPPSSGTA